MLVEEPIPGVLVFKNSLLNINFDYKLLEWKDWLPYGKLSNIKLDQLVDTNFTELYWYAVEYYKNKYNIDLQVDKNFGIGSIDLLHYKKTNKKFIGNSPEVLAMDYHVDNGPWNFEKRGFKNFLTLTFYVNDDYEGGNIKFIDLSSAEDGQYNDINGNIKPCIYINEPVEYKISKGDLTIFPSSYPYYHGVTPIINGNRYLLRTIYKKFFKGSKKWEKDLKVYGKEYMEKIDQDLAEKGFLNRENVIKVYSKVSDIQDIYDHPIYIIKERVV
jgi:hypothetical protein